MKHIGMDVHSSTTDVCVRNGRGTIILRKRIVTGKLELRKLVTSITGPKRVMVEESQFADWVTRALADDVEEVIRCQPRFNRLISASEDKRDKTDAESLSDLLYLDRFKAVHHPSLTYRRMRQAVRGYWMASREVTRAKNRIKNCFLGEGLHEVGEGIYSVRKRDENLKRLQQQGGWVELAELLFERMDQSRKLKAQHLDLLRKTAQPVKDLVRRVMTIPAIGWVSAYTMVALLENGKRLPNKRKLWKYGGMSIWRHESQGTGTQGASPSGNRLLKHVAMSAAMTIVARGEDNALLRRWEKEIREKVDPKRARRNLARKIVVIAQCLLRSGQEYCDERVMI